MKRSQLPIFIVFAAVVLVAQGAWAQSESKGYTTTEAERIIAEEYEQVLMRSPDAGGHAGVYKGADGEWKRSCLAA